MADSTYTLDDLGINSNRPIFSYDVAAQLNSLPLYDICEGVDRELDLAREVILSHDYVYQGVGFPEIQEGDIVGIAPYATISGTITVPANSYLVSLAHWNKVQTADNPILGEKGFRIRIYDKGAKTELFYNKFARDITASSPMGQSDPNPDTTSTQAIEIANALAPRWITSPMIILPPGTLHVEITNLAQYNNLIQVLFNFAIPLGGKATNVVVIDEGGLR